MALLHDEGLVFQMFPASCYCTGWMNLEMQKERKGVFMICALFVAEDTRCERNVMGIQEKKGLR